MIHAFILVLALAPALIQRQDPLESLPGIERVDDVMIVDDVPYALDHPRQVMDVAMPRSHDGLLPVVVIIHGGGWVAGDKEQVRMFLPPVAQGGCMAISANYRLAPGDQAPAAIHDIKYLLRWLDRNSEALSIDRERIALMGFSAGGHLAALAGLTCDTKELDPDQPGSGAPVCCIVSIGGPMNLKMGSRSSRGESLIREWIGSRDEAGPDKLDFYSPVEWLNEGDPPILLIHGEEDQVVSRAQATRMRRACDRAKVPCQIELIEDGAHMPAVATYASPLMKFLDGHLDSSIESYMSGGAIRSD